ncbi:MAG: sulfotransferase [Anaerolineae bacterium]
MIADQRAGDYFFIVGCSRSGTTLLSVLLDRHSRLCVTPETAFFDEIAPQLAAISDERSLLRLLRQWRRLPELHLEPESVLQHLAQQHRQPTAGNLLASLLDLYAHGQGKQRGGEKTPQHLAHVATITRCFPNAKFICLLRDGREVALSLRAMPWWGSSDLQAAANHWKLCLRQMESCVQQYPAQFQVIKFEELVSQPEATLTIVMDYLGERFEPDQLRTDLPSGVVLERSREWKGQALEPVDATRISGRREKASTAEIAFLEQALSDDLRRYGYLP